MVGVALGIARGLGELHRQGVVHADLSATNVLLASPPCSSQGLESVCSGEGAVDRTKGGY